MPTEAELIRPATCPLGARPRAGFSAGCNRVVLITIEHWAAVPSGTGKPSLYHSPTTDRAVVLNPAIQSFVKSSKTLLSSEAGETAARRVAFLQCGELPRALKHLMADHDDKQPRARLSQKEKLEKRLSQNAITAERADKIKSAYAIIVAPQFRHRYIAISVLATPALENLNISSNHFSSPFVQADGKDETFFVPRQRQNKQPLLQPPVSVSDDRRPLRSNSTLKLPPSARATNT
jgi:hypothetical protein